MTSMWQQRMTSSTQGSVVKEMARIDSTTRIIKRFEAGALLCAMLWQLVSCAGTQSQPDETTTSSPAEESSTANEITETSGVPADLDLDGEVITVWCTTEAYDILALEEQTGDILDDTIYMANTAVQERLNCGIEFVNSGYGSSTDTAAISTLLLADDTTYDLYLPVQWSGGKLVSQGLYLNVADAPYISFDEPWWDLDYMKEMSVGNEKIFTLVGDYSRHRTEMLNCIYYNKQLYEDFYGDGDGLYQVVLDGEFTLERYKQICEDVYVDIDNDGAVSLGDRLGAVQCWNGHTMALLYCSELRITERDEDGIPYLVMNTEHNMDIIRSVYELSRETTGIFYGTEVESINGEHQTERFLSDNAMFYYGSMGSSSTLRDMRSDYGVIPYPKYDENQENYHSMIGETMTFAALPYNCQKVDAVCAFIEELAFEGYHNVLPTYYETVLKTKYVRDDSSGQMLDIIRDNLVTDIALIYGSAFGNLCYAPRELIKSGSGEFAAKYASLESAAIASSEELIEQFTEMD